MGIIHRAGHVVADLVGLLAAKNSPPSPSYWLHTHPTCSLVYMHLDQKIVHVAGIHSTRSTEETPTAW